MTSESNYWQSRHLLRVSRRSIIGASGFAALALACGKSGGSTLQSAIPSTSSQPASGGTLFLREATNPPTPATVVFKLKYPYALCQSTLASATYGWILPREANAGTYDPAKQIIGSGPFIAGDFTPAVSFSFKRNPDWYAKGRPYVEGLQW